jgi:tetratricopeptide (TPR) repeat protein
VVDSLEREIQGLRALLHTDRDPQGRAFVSLADAYRRARDLERALEVVSIGLERHPELASAYVVEAWVQQDRGDPNGAAAAWERVLELDPDNVEALRGLGNLMAAAGRASRADPLLERARELEPDRANVGEVDASAPPASDDVPLVAPEPDDAAEGEPEDTHELPATRTLAELYARQGLHDRAAEVYERLARERPDDAGVRKRLAELRAKGSAPPPAPVPSGVHDEDTETLARELASPPGLPEPFETLFAWGHEEPAGAETPEPAQTIGSYFRDLLAWSRTGRETAAGTIAVGTQRDAGRSAVITQSLEGMEGALGRIVPIESLAPVIVPIESLSPDGPVPVDSLAPAAVPIETLAPRRGPAIPGSS